MKLNRASGVLSHSERNGTSVSKRRGICHPPRKAAPTTFLIRTHTHTLTSCHPTLEGSPATHRPSDATLPFCRSYQSLLMRRRYQSVIWSTPAHSGRCHHIRYPTGCAAHGVQSRSPGNYRLPCHSLCFFLRQLCHRHSAKQRAAEEAPANTSTERRWPSKFHGDSLEHNFAFLLGTTADHDEYT